MNYKLLLPDHFFIHSYLPLNYATWSFVAHGKKYFWKEMIIKEKVYISFPSSLYRERGRGQPIKFSTRTRWELIMVGLVVKLTLTSLHRGGGSQELIIILQGTKVGGVKLITPLPSIQNKQIISNFPSLPI